MDKSRLVGILNQDIESEHGAIIQYLTHAYAIGEGELACEIEGIAREDMRHLDWLAEMVVDLGGTPSVARGEMRMGGLSVSDWMRNDVLLEEDAITPYRQQIGVIDDPKVNRLLRRILADEESHHGDFEHFADKASRDGLTDVRGARDDRTVQLLNWGIEHEYTVILQYLFHSYMATDDEVRRQLMDQAVNEMQHLGWLAEKLIDISGCPSIEHTEVDQSRDMMQMLDADIRIENQVTHAYDEATRELDDSRVVKLLVRIRDQEIYHSELFEELLAELRKGRD
jgi:bacterioferritin